MKAAANYFVDEAGDSNLFNRKGKVIINTDGCSRYFMMGLLEVGDLPSLASEMRKLRKKILSDPYYQGIPSLKPENRKTALAFHATDDIAEVRREVFELLNNRTDLSFFAVIGDKFSTLDYVKNRQLVDEDYCYHPDETYDFLVRRLFRDRLHQKELYKIVFAKRGNRQRTGRLKSQLEIARQRFIQKYHGEYSSRFEVRSGQPKNHVGLQAVDYFLWALQRLYERREERFLVNIWHHCKLVIDVHDVRNHKYGEYYDKRNPLTIASLDGR